MAKIAIIYYSMYGHIKALADSEKKGIEAAGGQVDVYQIPETLPDEVLSKMHAQAKPTDVPVISDPAVLEEYDGFLLGIPTRYGRMTGQWAAFWDKAGKQWATGSLHGKMAGIFVSSAGMGGGQEMTVVSTLSQLTHLGIIYVPLGYAHSFPILGNTSEARGGSPWGAGVVAGSDGSRKASPQELLLAEIQGKTFYQTLAKYNGA